MLSHFTSACTLCSCYGIQKLHGATVPLQIFWSCCIPIKLINAFSTHQIFGLCMHIAPSGMHTQHQWWTHFDHNTKNSSALIVADHNTGFIDQNTWNQLPATSACNQCQIYVLRTRPAHLLIINWMHRDSAAGYWLQEGLCLTSAEIMSITLKSFCALCSRQQCRWVPVRIHTRWPCTVAATDKLRNASWSCFALPLWVKSTQQLREATHTSSCAWAMQMLQLYFVVSKLRYITGVDWWFNKRITRYDLGIDLTSAEQFKIHFECSWQKSCASGYNIATMINEEAAVLGSPV